MYERLPKVKLMLFTQVTIIALCVFATDITGQDKTGIPPLPTPPALPEVQRVIKMMPVCQTAKLFGQPVHVWHTIPVTFSYK